MIITFQNGNAYIYKPKTKAGLKAQYRFISKLLKLKKPFSISYK